MKKPKNNVKEVNKVKGTHVSTNDNKLGIKSILLVIISTILIAIGHVFFKFSVGHLDSIHSIITNIPLILGFVFYALASLMLILALQRGHLSVIYPFIALSFIWVTILSIIIFHEHVYIHNWIGIIAIIVGVSLIGISSSK